jgi:hypothetical protein
MNRSVGGRLRPGPAVWRMNRNSSRAMRKVSRSLRVQVRESTEEESEEVRSRKRSDTWLLKEERSEGSRPSIRVVSAGICWLLHQRGRETKKERRKEAKKARRI